ncbi:hypothetical protein PC113_g16663 [Phytophthora cactorum]|uniref:Uncharacterized protein n=1 Tax=Phytophthora cactorum TaxID=29920 RepID=A0A8T0YLC3_9STRA|nr:hypothetical protein PC113_g16663 [Phytophthora cactorum]
MLIPRVTVTWDFDLVDDTLLRQHQQDEGEKETSEAQNFSADSLRGNDEALTPSGSGPIELNNLSVSAIAPIQKSAEQVKHRMNAKEGESAIVFGTNDNWN